MRRLAVLLSAALLVAAGCGSTPEPSQPKPQASGPIGAPEKTTIKIGMRLPNLDTNAPIEIALDKGFYKEEGLTVERIEVQSIREGLVGGSLDFGAEAAPDVVAAATAGTGLKIVAGYRNREPFVVAVQPEITKPQDLAGKPILLGANPGTIEYDVRANLLKEAGFDLTGVAVKPVNLPGGSNAWVEQFKQRKLALTVLFPRHKQLVEEAGGKLVLDVMKEWPNDSITATQDFVDNNPNTTARFIRATLKAMKVFKDPAQQQYVQTMMKAKGFMVSPLEEDAAVYANGPLLYDEDMGLAEQGFTELLGVLKMPPAPFASFTSLEQLHRAQADLGLTTRP